MQAPPKRKRRYKVLMDYSFYIRATSQKEAEEIVGQLVRKALIALSATSKDIQGIKSFPTKVEEFKDDA